MIHSYSFLNQFYNVCPESARCQFVTRTHKRKYEGKMGGGIDDHKALDDRLKYKVPLPEAMAHVEPYCQSFERYPLKTEVSLAIDAWCNPCGFWGEKDNKNVQPWLRGKFDLLAQPDSSTILYVDWKSGKVREKADQIELGACLVFANNPAVDRLVGFNCWIGTPPGQMGTKYEFTRSHMSPVWAKWIAKMRYVDNLHPNEEWEKHPGPLCRFCPVNECEHHPKEGK